MTESKIRGFPLLRYNEDKSIISGSIIVDDTDSYDIQIALRGFPNGVPVVYETEGRIPRKDDRHTYNSGELCLTTEPNMEIYLKSMVKTIEDFINFLVVPFLQNNSYYELKRGYKFDEYTHEPFGSTYETYRDILGVTNIQLLIRTLEQRLKIRPNEKCYCQSNIKIKNCSDHSSRYKKFRLLSKERLRKDIILLKTLLNELLKLKTR